VKELYLKSIPVELQKELKIKNKYAVPLLKKIVVNIGIGSHITKQGKKDYETFVDSMKLITGQCPVVRKAKKAISNFKLRQGMPVGLVVTLRGRRMYDFITKLINIALPRIRDFQGLSVKGFDKEGNYNIGVKEHTIFPEINVENVTNIHGLQINIVTSADNNYGAFMLLKKMNFPFKDEVRPNI